VKKELRSRSSRTSSRAASSRRWPGSARTATKVRNRGGRARGPPGRPGGAFAYFRGQRAREADRALQDALAMYAAPAASEIAAGADRSEAGLRHREDKFKTAAAAFEASSGASAPPGVGLRAKYYAALSGSGARPVRRGREGAQGDPGAGEAARAGARPGGPGRSLPRSGKVDQAVRPIAASPPTRPRTSRATFALLSAAQTLEDRERWGSPGRPTGSRRGLPASVYAVGGPHAGADFRRTPSADR